MNRVGSKGVVRRIAAALVLSAAPFVAVERGEAACSPDPLVNNATATCTDATTNQSGINGLRTGAETGVTITVDPTAGATVNRQVPSRELPSIAISDGTINNRVPFRENQTVLTLGGLPSAILARLPAPWVLASLLAGPTVVNKRRAVHFCWERWASHPVKPTVTNAGVVEATGTGGVAISQSAGIALTPTNCQYRSYPFDPNGDFTITNWRHTDQQQRRHNRANGTAASPSKCQHDPEQYRRLPGTIRPMARTASRSRATPAGDFRSINVTSNRRHDLGRHGCRQHRRHCYRRQQRCRHRHGHQLRHHSGEQHRHRHRWSVDAG